MISTFVTLQLIIYIMHKVGEGVGERGGGLCHSFWYQSRSGQDVETSQLYPFLFRLWHILSYLFTSQVIQKSCLFKSKMISLFKDIRWFIAVINFLCICPKFLQNEYFFFCINVHHPFKNMLQIQSTASHFSKW